MPPKLTPETFPEVTELDNLPKGKTDLKTVADVGPEPTAAVFKSSLRVIVAYSQRKSNNNINNINREWPLSCFFYMSFIHIERGRYVARNPNYSLYTPK